MGVEFASERKLLAESELGFVQNSHYPALESLDRAALVDLARWLREQRARARGIIATHRRVRRGKQDARSASAGEASERGMMAKKQVYARALKRVNARIDALDAAAKRARAVATMRAALAARHARASHAPAGAAGATDGMRPRPSRKPRPTIHGARIGSVSQQGRVAQARADARG